MSYEELGTNYKCDLCDKVENSTTGLPNNWESIRVRPVSPYSYQYIWYVHFCKECWPKETPELKKTLAQRFKDFVGRGKFK